MHESKIARRYQVKEIGRVKSSLPDLDAAPRQADEGAPEAWLVFEAEVLPALRNLRAGDEVILITWLDRARRDVLTVHPRGDEARPGGGCSAPARRTGPTRLVSTESRLPPSTAGGCRCVVWRRSMGHRSWISSRF